MANSGQSGGATLFVDPIIEPHIRIHITTNKWVFNTFCSVDTLNHHILPSVFGHQPTPIIAMKESY